MLNSPQFGPDIYSGGKLVFSCDPQQKAFIYPETGEHTLVCQDDHGRSTSMKLVIR